MEWFRRKLSVYFLALALVLPGIALQSAAAAESIVETGPSELDMATDGLLIRPLGIVGTAVGGVLYIVTLPFSTLGGNAGEAKQVLVDEPFKFTFRRPLGQFPR